MARTAINLYSVRDLDAPMADVLDRTADAGYDGVQFAGDFRDADPEEAAAILDELGLEAVAPHVDVDALENDLESTLETYRDALGCDGAVVPYLDEASFESEGAVEETATRLSELADRVAGEGWTLHYHNHDHEFVRLDGEPAFERFVRAADGVGIELDVGWALVGGVDPAAFVDRHADRIDLLHLKDMGVEERAFREIGEGDVDVAACAAAGRRADVEWFVYEHDDPEDPARSIERGGAFVNEL